MSPCWSIPGGVTQRVLQNKNFRTLELLGLQRLTYRVGPSYIEFIQILQHSEEQNPCLWVFRVRDEGVNAERVNDTKHSLPYISERKEMTTNSN
jgi:hypothetical protein